MLLRFEWLAKQGFDGRSAARNEESRGANQVTGQKPKLGETLSTIMNFDQICYHLYFYIHNTFNLYDLVRLHNSQHSYIYTHNIMM